MNKKRFTYAIIPFILTALLLFISYFGNQMYADIVGNTGKDYSYIFLKFNQLVPFLSWTIYPYIIAYPFWVSAFFIIAFYSKDNFYNILAVIFITFIICGLWYFFFQSDVEAWRVTSGLFLNDNYLTPRTDLNFTEKIVMLIYQAAGPRNALPSMHTLMSWITIIGVRHDKTIPKKYKILIWVIALSIIISTQTLKQHYIIDLIVGMALAEGTYWIMRNTKFVSWIRNLFTKINSKLNLE